MYAHMRRSTTANTSNQQGQQTRATQNHITGKATTQQQHEKSKRKMKNTKTKPDFNQKHQEQKTTRNNKTPQHQQQGN